MEIIRLFEENKNKILNAGIVVLALFIAFQIYKADQARIDSLARQKSTELEKNKVTEEIAILEKKVKSYKEIFTKKDVGSVINALSDMAKNCSIKIISLKPGSNENYQNYIKSVFLMTVSAPGYHSLGKFIGQIESCKDIYVVDEIGVSPIINESAEGTENINLDVDLKISTISYL